MTGPLAPALTPEVWAEIQEDAVEPQIISEALAYEVSYWRGRADPAAIIALANAALPDTDPRKIRRRWIVALREMACCPAHNADCAEIAAALAAYLSPAAR